MQYALVFGNQGYELPKLSISIVNKMEKIDNDNLSPSISKEQKYKNMYSFVKELVGDDTARDMFGADKFDEIDLNDINIAYIGIASAYDKPVNDYRQNQSVSSKLNDDDRQMILELLKNAGSLNEVLKLNKQNLAKQNMARFTSL